MLRVAAALIGCLQVLPVATIWFAAQYTFTLSLAHTSVTSNTILSSSSSMFTLLASALLLQERITWAKLASVASVMAGEGEVEGTGGQVAGPVLGLTCCTHMPW